MPVQEILVLAMTKMLSGICTAGFTCEHADTTGLCWVRPVRDFDTVLPGDMMDSTGYLIQCCDVIELPLSEPQPEPPHVEDWVVDFVHHRPKLLRRLEGDKRAEFFAHYLDQATEDILVHHTRSLALVAPVQVWASFSLDRYSDTFHARMGFTLPGDVQHPKAQSARGVSVTDLKWRALGRCWLGDKHNQIKLCSEALMERLQAQAIYLTIGLSRKWRNEYWPLVHAVHIVPDYSADIDPACL